MYNPMPVSNSYGNYSPYGMNNLYQPYSNVQEQKIIQVHGEDGAKAFALSPNSSVLLMDETDAIIWAKVTDGAGYATLQGFRITPLEQKTSNHQDEYVTKSDFNALKDRFDKLMEDLGNDKSDS